MAKLLLSFPHELGRCNGDGDDEDSIVFLDKNSYGLFTSRGDVRAYLPDDMDIASMTLADALDLIDRKGKKTKSKSKSHSPSPSRRPKKSPKKKTERKGAGGNGFIAFMQANKSRVQADNPGMAWKDCLKLLGEEYRSR